jgi:PPOX class probable F420-dependent enzyme
MTRAGLAQGSIELLTHDVAQRLLASRELARLAYTAADGTPRVLPMLFHWTGDELVMSTFAGAKKVAALRARPAVAVSIDTPGPPPEVLLLRGEAELTEVEGIVDEYALAHVRYYGPEQGAANVADADRPGVRMVRIALRPSWVGVIDFQTRFPGGGTAEDFDERGRA